MAVADIVVLAIVVLSLLVGLWRGLVKEALSLACWIAAVVLAVLFNARVAGLLGDWIASPGLQRIVAFVLIFVVTVFVGGLVSTLVSKLTSAVGLQAADRALGGLFGLARGLCIVTLGVMLTAPFETFRPWYAESRSAPWLLALAERLRAVLEEQDLLPPESLELPGGAADEADDLARDGYQNDLARCVGVYTNRGKNACVA